MLVLSSVVVIKRMSAKFKAQMRIIEFTEKNSFKGVAHINFVKYHQRSYNKSIYGKKKVPRVFFAVLIRITEIDT